MIKKPIKTVLVIILIILAAVGTYNVYRPLPKNISYESQLQSPDHIKFLKDITWMNAGGHLENDQEIFKEIFNYIEKAQTFILIDMFLFNNYMGDTMDNSINISKKLSLALINKKIKNPDIYICVITDPINTVYNGLVNPIFEDMEQNKIHVVFTDLDKLRDSNPIYSSFYRMFLSYFKNTPGTLVKSPFGNERVSLLSYFKLLNFKANHRKTFICDINNTLYAVVSSANPHDGSSLHQNAGASFSGKPCLYLLESEKAVLKMSNGPMPPKVDIKQNHPDSQIKLKIITEKKILENIIKEIKATEKGDEIDIVMFYLSHTKIIKKLQEASKKGVKIKVLLDLNKDAFGRTKNGIPNRVTASMLAKKNIKVKWAATNGEQLHTKLMLIKKTSGDAVAITGSSNYTRRNLNNLNLESNILVKGKYDHLFFQDIDNYINLLWNDNDKNLSFDYNKVKEDIKFKIPLYYFMEKTGLSTF